MKRVLVGLLVAGVLAVGGLLLLTGWPGAAR